MFAIGRTVMPLPIASRRSTTKIDKPTERFATLLRERGNLAGTVARAR
jgi:hypothetical protein